MKGLVNYEKNSKYYINGSNYDIVYMRKCPE